MRRLKWSDNYSVYMPDIDEEHRQIFDAAGLLSQSLLAGDVDLKPLMARIIEHAAAHFAHEEELMRVTRYPGYAWHKRQHETAVNYLAPLAQDGSRKAAVELLRFLSDWLRNHVRMTDRIMGAYVRNRSRLAAIAS
jgi:hemerythrin-like metal-binding protein